MPNFYDVLKVSKDASLDEIKKSYKRLSLQYHPDRAGQESTAKTQEINDAYETLSDPKLRADYDMKIPGIDAIHKEDFLHKDDGTLSTYSKEPSASIYEKIYDDYKLSFKARKKLNNLKELIDEYSNKETYTYNNKSFFSIYNLIHEKEIHHEPCAFEISPDRDFDISYVTELFTEFLNGNIFGLALEKFKQNLAEVIKTSNYFAAIYGIISVNFTDKRTKNLLINSFNELTKYLINTTDELTHEQTLLFASKKFHALQSLVHALFWKYLHNLKFKTPDGQTHTNFFIDHFDGSDECFEHLKYLKSAVNENDPRLLLCNNLMYFEMNVSNKAKKLEKASELRELAFKTLNWVTYLNQSKNTAPEILINMYLQAGAYLLAAAQSEKNLPEKFADEKLAFDLFEAVVNSSSKLDALTELYILNNIIGLLLNVELIGAEIKDKLRSYIARFEKISSIYPLFQFIQSATELIKSVPKFQNFRKKLLKSLYEAYNTKAIEEDKDLFTLTYKDILYEIYVCSLNGQYYHEINSDDFYKIRFELMNRLTQELGYTIDSVSQNLGQPTVMVRRTDDGWLMQAPQSIPFLTGSGSRQRFQTLNSIVISFWSGDFNLELIPGDWTPHTGLISIADIVHIFTRRITEARFSLDEVDHTRPYLPFYKMTYSPNTLTGTDFLRTLFLTDYLLKVFTVGQDVSSIPDFRFTTISQLIKGLPSNLKAIIDNYHQAEPSENNTHRFWIETENAETVFKKFNYTKVISISDVKMVVKKQAMTRDKEGKLIDDVNAHEGWDIYIVDPSIEWNIFHRIFKVVDTKIFRYQYNIPFNKKFIERFRLSKDIRRPSIIIHYENDHAFFIEAGKISNKFDLSDLNETIQELKKLDRDRNDCVKFNGQKREIQEKIYEATLAISRLTKMKHYFSREYVFTYEFTKNYEEFGEYFPEFLRLRELSKICLYIEHLELIHSCVKDRQRGHNLVTDLLVSHTKLNKAFEKIGIGTYKDEGQQICPLVPASLNRQNTAGRIHFSYGGVRVKPSSYPIHWRMKSASEQFIAKTTEKSVYKCSPDDYQSARSRFEKGNIPQRTEFRQEPQSSFFTRTQPQSRTTGTYYTGSSAARASGGYQHAQTSGSRGGAAAAGASVGGSAAGGHGGGSGNGGGKDYPNALRTNSPKRSAQLLPGIKATELGTYRTGANGGDLYMDEEHATTFSGRRYTK